MHSVEMYVPVRRAHMVEGRSVREAPRQRGHRGTRRCALRERRRGEGPAQPAVQLRRPNPTPAAHRRILRPRGRGKRAVLPAWGRGEAAAPRELRICYLRTSQHFTLKDNSLQRHHLDDFVACYNSDYSSQRAPGETEQFRWFTDDEW